MATGNTRTITASEFRAKCLQLLDEVAATREEIVITKRGRPVCRLTPPTFVDMLLAMPQDDGEFERWPMQVRDVEF